MPAPSPAPAAAPAPAPVGPVAGTDRGRDRARGPGAVAALLVPASLLAVDRWGWSPFGPLRWLVVTTLGAIAVAWSLGERDGPRAHRPTARAWALLLALLALAAVTGLDRWNAWLGTPERHLGILTWVLCAGLFLVGQRLDAGGATRVLRGAVVATAGIGAVTVAEWLDHPVVAVTGTSGRLGGPFGSPAYLGAAMVLLLPVAAGCALDRAQPAAWRTAAALAVAVGLVPVVGSASRAAAVALAGAAGLAGAAAVARRRAAGTSWPTRPVALGGGVAVLGMAAVVALVPLGDRLAATLDPAEGGSRSRVDEWRTGLAALVDRPLLGDGPEGYRIAFPGVVDADYVRAHGRSTVTDRAHLGVLDVALAGGVGAAAAYTALWGGVAVAAWSVLRRPAAPTAVAGAAVGVVAFGAHQQLLFPLAEVDPVAWLLAGLVVAAAVTGPRPAPARWAAWRRPVAAVAWAFAGLAFVAGVLDVAADHDARQALDRAAGGDPAAAVAAADRATGRRPDSMRYHLVAAVVAADPGTLPALAAGLERIDDALDLSPRDPVLAAERARLLGERALLTGHPDDLSAARAAWDTVLDRDPRHPAHLVALARVASAQGDVAAAEAACRHAADLSPGDATPWVVLTGVRLDAGDGPGARRAAETAVAVAPDDPAALGARAAAVEAAAAPGR